MVFKIVRKMSFDSPPKPYWVVREMVTSKGHYIELPGIYTKRESAQKEVTRLKKKGRK